MRLVVAINDRCTINRDGRRPMVRSIDRCLLRSIVRAIVAFYDRSYEQSWHPMTDRTSTRGILRPSVLSIVAPEYRWYDQSCGATIDRMINHSIVRPIVRSIVATYDQSYDQSWYQAIWNRRLDVLNMTNDLATTDFALAITHDLCDQSYVLSTICLQFQHCSVAGRR